MDYKAKELLEGLLWLNDKGREGAIELKALIEDCEEPLENFEESLAWIRDIVDKKL